MTKHGNEFFANLFSEIQNTSTNGTVSNEPFIPDIPQQTTNIKEIFYNGQYIKEDAGITFTTVTKRNQYLIKSNTGAGGTTLMLNDNESNSILLTPNRSQVRNKQSKDDTFKSKQRFFIYGESKGKSHNWEQVSQAMQITDKGIKVMSVFDSFFHLKDSNPDLYDYFKDIPLIIDECHTMIKESWRPITKLMYNEIQTWRAPVKFSTATPQPNYIDMPPNMNIELIKLTSNDKRNQIVFYSENKDDAFALIESELNLDHDVLVFTNYADDYNVLTTKYKGLGGDSTTNRVHSATGKSLSIKTKGFDIDSYQYRATDIVDRAFGYEDEDLKSLEGALTLPHKRLFILSKAYFAGVDFTRKATVIVLSDRKYNTCDFDWMDSQQALGRAREGFYQVLLVNSPHGKDKDGNPKQRVGMKWIDYHAIDTQQLLDNRLAEIGKGIDYETVEKQALALNQFITLNYDARIKQFADVGYHLQPYPSSATKQKKEKTKFSAYILNLMTYDIHEIESEIIISGKYQLKNELWIDNEEKSFGIITPEYVFKYYVAWVLMKYNPIGLINMLRNDTAGVIKAKEFGFEVREFLLQYLDKEYHNIDYDFDNYDGDFILDGNPKPTENTVYEFILLYAGCGYDEDGYSHEVLRQMRISTVIGDRVKLVDLLSNPDKVEIAARRIKSRLKKKHTSKEDENEIDGIELTKDEMTYVRKKVRENFDWLSEWHKDNEIAREKFCRKYPNKFFTPKPAYNVVTKNMLKKRIRKACLFFFTRGTGTYAPRYIDSRCYSALTQLSSNLRVALPIKFISFDVKRANPTIICKLLKRPNDVVDYEKIAKIFSLGVGEGKTFFNSTINNHNLDSKEAKRRYLKFGFTDSEADQLVRWTSGVGKGDMFRRMIEAEELLIYYFKEQALNDFKNELSSDMFFRFHDAVIIPTFQLGECKLQCTFGETVFVRTEFNTGFEWGF